LGKKKKKKIKKKKTLMEGKSDLKPPSPLVLHPIDWVEFNKKSVRGPKPTRGMAYGARGTKSM